MYAQLIEGDTTPERRTETDRIVNDLVTAIEAEHATNIQTRIERDGDEYVINGRKWWTSNALHLAAPASAKGVAPAELVG